jgi:hypothetical protein
MRTIIADDDGTPPSEIGMLRREEKNRKFTMKSLSSVDDRKSLEEIFFVYTAENETVCRPRIL